MTGASATLAEDLADPLTPDPDVMNPNKLTAPTLPDSCMLFAKAAAALAESHGITSFEMKIKPDFGEDYTSERSIQGDIVVHYWAKDGRGRPSRNIRINVVTNLTATVEWSPESTS